MNVKEKKEKEINNIAEELERLVQMIKCNREKISLDGVLSSEEMEKKYRFLIEHLFKIANGRICTDRALVRLVQEYSYLGPQMITLCRLLVSRLRNKKLSAELVELYVDTVRRYLRNPYRRRLPRARGDWDGPDRYEEVNPREQLGLPSYDEIRRAENILSRRVRFF